MKLSEKMRKRASVNVPVGGQRLYAWIDEVAQLEVENAKLKRALQKVHKGPSAQAIDFTKSPELCAWVCDTIDMVADTLLKKSDDE